MTEQEVQHFKNAQLHELLQVANENTPRGFLARLILNERQTAKMERIAMFSAIAAVGSAIAAIVQLFFK